jgi:3-hydroxyacyl-[acyl-carrier-protein] dehydratase
MNALQKAIEQGALNAPQACETDSVCRSFRFGKEFAGFDGHFPDYPILPAVAQIQMILSTAQMVLKTPVNLLGVLNAKFMIPIKPEQEIVVKCHLMESAQGVEVKARLTLGPDLAATFTLQLERASHA